jgi:LacI family transcriptional regulator
MRSLNQQLLAEKLNISRTTVSRSLANHPAISADTRDKVQKLAAEMGYHGNPTRGVRRPRQSKAATIGVLIGVPAANVALATFPFILQGIRERAEVEHLAVDVCFEKPASLDPSSKRQRVFRHIRAGDWRGIILIYLSLPRRGGRTDRAKNFDGGRARELHRLGYRHHRY